jgi:peptide/nickel transport system substrate-binding protein
MENFTLGIMPAHLWNSLPIEQLPFSQLNTEPIGTGPYMINEAKRDASGVITEYQLVAFGDNAPQPNIQDFIFKFFNQESDIIDAMATGDVDTTGYISNENLGVIDTSAYNIHTMTLPRIFGVFFNPNRSTALLDDSVRKALSVAINREELIDEVLNGYGVPITIPIASIEATLESDSSNLSTSTTTTIEQAREILSDGNWEQNELGFWEKEIDDVETTLSITLRTSNTPLFETTLQEIAETWRTVGVEVVTEQFEQTGLIQSVIRPRDFQALLFGIDMSRSYDLYPFWHSSQKDDPGLNIAQYTNLTVDGLLEEARSITDTVRRDELLYEAGEIIAEESPAVLLFQPEFVYVVNNQVEIELPDRPGKPADRFSSLNEWHTTSDILWPAFKDTL